MKSLKLLKSKVKSSRKLYKHNQCSNYSSLDNSSSTSSGEFREIYQQWRMDGTFGDKVEWVEKRIEHMRHRQYNVDHEYFERVANGFRARSLQMLSMPDDKVKNTGMASILGFFLRAPNEFNWVDKQYHIGREYDWINDFQRHKSCTFWSELRNANDIGCERYIEQFGGITHREAEDLADMLRPATDEMYEYSFNVLNRALVQFSSHTRVIENGIRLMYPTFVNDFNSKRFVEGDWDEHYSKSFSDTIFYYNRYYDAFPSINVDIKNVEDVEILNYSVIGPKYSTMAKVLPTRVIGLFQIHAKITCIEKYSYDNEELAKKLGLQIKQDPDVTIDNDGYCRRCHVITINNAIPIGVLNGTTRSWMLDHWKFKDWCLDDFNLMRLSPRLGPDGDEYNIRPHELDFAKAVIKGKKRLTSNWKKYI